MLDRSEGTEGGDREGGEGGSEGSESGEVEHRAFLDRQETRSRRFHSIS